MRRRLARLRRWLLTGVACLLVAAAGLMALGRLLVPWLVDSPEDVAQWLGERIGRPVHLDGVAASWDGPGPILDLEGLSIAAGAGDPAAVTLGRARVQIDVYGLLIPGRPLIRDFLLVDAHVDLVRELDGRIALIGFEGATASASGLSTWLSRVGHLGVTGGALTLVDKGSGRSFQIDQVELRLSQHGEHLALALERHANDGDGRLRVVVEVANAEQPALVDAQCFVEAQDFPLAQLQGLLAPLSIGVRDGMLDGRQWTSWRRGELADTQGDWSLRSLVLAAPAFGWSDGGLIEPNTHLPEGRVVLNGARQGDEFLLDARLGAGLDAEQLTGAISLRRREAIPQWTLAAEHLPVAVLAAAAQLFAAAPETLRAKLYAAQPQGAVEHLQARLQGSDWQVYADLTDLAVRPAGAHWPELTGLDASISADDEAIVVQVNRDPVQLAVPGVFRAPIDLSALSLQLSYRQGPDGWLLSMPTVQIEGAGFAADLSVNLSGNPVTGAHLDLNAHVPGAQIEAAKAFWVLNKMSPRTVSWLDHALSDGRVVAGDVVYRGDLKDWPFRQHEGRFEARFTVDGATLDYHPDWPRAENVAAEAAFVNSSMVIERATGRVVGNRIVSGKGGIAELKEPILTLDLAGEGDAVNWMRLLKSSPLQRNFGETLFGMAMEGPADIGARLYIPLKKELGPVTIEGQALLRGVHFSDTKWDLDFTQVHGRADFSERGFAADRLVLEAAGRPAELSIAVGAFSSDPTKQVEASLRGNLSAQALFGHHDDLATVLAQVSGSADWDVSLGVRRSPVDGRAAGATVRYRSALEGIGVGFPAPLGKAADSKLGLDLRVELPGGDLPPTLELDIGNQAHLYADIGTRERDFRGELQFGAPREHDLPSSGLRVTGHADTLDLAAWAGWVYTSAAPGAEDSVLSDVDITVGSATPFDRLRLDRSDGPWVLRVDGPSAAGSVRFETPAHGPAAVVAQFEHLYLPEPGDGVGDLAITPRMVPTLHLWTGDLRVGTARLGEARLEAFSTDAGLRVDLLEARSPDLEVYAKGDWIDTAGGAESRFQIRMTSENLGRMLTGLGFAGVIDGGQTLAQIDARWRGAPFAFALERLTGSIDVSVGHGRFMDVDPGAGRIFGLLSLRELPRRLTLDFRDLFQAGMSFDRIEGRFQLSDGNAWTENLTVRSPAADILIIGRTGLASRDYDQQVMVSPHMSGVLPVIGGLAAGPVGAAAGFLAQGMVQTGGDIEKSSRVHYSIAGSWERPVVARLTPIRPDAPPRRREAGEADAG